MSTFVPAFDSLRTVYINLNKEESQALAKVSTAFSDLPDRIKYNTDSSSNYECFERLNFQQAVVRTNVSHLSAFVIYSYDNAGTYNRNNKLDIKDLRVLIIAISRALPQFSNRQKFLDYFLYEFAFAGDKESTQFLLEHGANPNEKIKRHTSSILMLFCCEIIENGETILRLLLKYNGDANAKYKDDRTLLHRIFPHNCAYAEVLIEHGAKIDSLDKDGCSPLVCAVSHNAYDQVKLMVDKDKTLVAKKDKRGLTPAGYVNFNAIGERIIEILLDSGASLMQVNIHGEFIWKNIISLCSVDFIAKLLQKYPEIIELEDNERRSALHIACLEKRDDVAFLLLNHGARIAKDHYGVTPLHTAALNHNEKLCARIISENHLSATIKNIEGFTPLTIFPQIKLYVAAAKLASPPITIKEVTSGGVSRNSNNQDFLDGVIIKEDVEMQKEMTAFLKIEQPPINNGVENKSIEFLIN